MIFSGPVPRPLMRDITALRFSGDMMSPRWRLDLDSVGEAMRANLFAGIEINNNLQKKR
jgi:hypothetical protein